MNISDGASMTTEERNMEEPLILKSELRSAIAKMKRNKAAGPGKIVIEMLTVLKNLGIN